MKYLVDETGEIIETIDDSELITKLKTGDRIVRSGTIEYLEDTVAIKMKFIKLNPFVCEKLYDYGNVLFSLSKYVNFQNGILMFQNGRYIKPKHLAGILKKKRRSGAQAIKELIDLDVIHKHKDGNSYYYTMNPYVIMKGKRITKSLYNEFKNSEYRNFGVNI